MRHFLITLLFLFAINGHVNAQKGPSGSIAVDAGYTLMGNKHGTNQGYIGGLLAVSTDEKRLYHGRPIHQFAAGGGIYYGRYNTHKTETIPTFTVAYSNLQPNSRPPLPYARVAVSKYNVHPSVGMNFINLIQVHVGYSHGYRRLNGIRMSGPTLSFNFNLGLGHFPDLSN